VERRKPTTRRREYLVPSVWNGLSERRCLLLPSASLILRRGQGEEDEDAEEVSKHVVPGPALTRLFDVSLTDWTRRPASFAAFLAGQGGPQEEVLEEQNRFAV